MTKEEFMKLREEAFYLTCHPEDASRDAVTRLARFALTARIPFEDWDDS